MISSTGQKLCSRHHISLITGHGYGTRDYSRERYLTTVNRWLATASPSDWRTGAMTSLNS
jgi:hypothetical protein